MTFLQRLLPRRASSLEKLRTALAEFRADYPKLQLTVEANGTISVQGETKTDLPPEVYDLADRVLAGIPNGSVIVLKDRT